MLANYRSNYQLALTIAGVFIGSLAAFLFPRNTAASVILVLIFAGLEELFFRKILFDYLKSKVSSLFTVLITSSLFALLHFNFDYANLLSLFFFGIYFALARLSSNGIALPTALHFSTNQVGYSAGFKSGNSDFVTFFGFTGQEFIRFSMVFDLTVFAIFVTTILLKKSKTPL